ncbi:MAG: hypothetical protein E7374_01200 [Clostridiales bacterium]|nr:hypothetical protein [Clostridiales bacterium]
MKKNDWRLTNQHNYITNAKLLKTSTLSIPRDHEHCIFCWEKFLQNEEAQREVYMTTDLKYLICTDCFNDFKSLFNWSITEINVDRKSEQ